MITMTGAATGITKIKKINNVGIFSAYTWPVPAAGKEELSFKKINLLYGCNGSGKTTLSNILGLFSEDHDELEIKRIEQGLSADTAKPLEIQIEWDGKTAKHPTDRKKLYVFNSAFVADHVYDGTQAKVKNFKQVVTKEHLSNPALKKITDTIAAETTKKGNAEAYLKKLEKLFNELKKAMSKTWNDNIDGKRMPSINLENCPQQAPKESEEKLLQALEEEFSKFKASKDQAALEKAIFDLGQIIATPVNLPDGMTDTIVRSITKAAREKVQAKIDVLKAHALKHGSIQNWFEDGASLLKQTKDNQKCPLCDSALPNIEDLIASYDTYFNDELAELMQETSKIIAVLEWLSTESDNKKFQSQRVQTLIAEYCYQDMVTDEEKSALSRLEAQEIKGLIQSVKSLFESKKESIDFTPTNEQLLSIKGLLAAKTELLADVALLVSVKDKIIARLQSARFDDKNAKEVCERLFWKRFDIQGKSLVHDALKAQEKEDAKLEIPDGIGGIGLFHVAKGDLRLIQAMLAKKESEKASELSKLKKESEYVNGFLSRLCVNNFTINTQDDGEITVHYSGVPPKKGIHYSLSEGEKTALAFAYFLSKYRHEVLDNPDAEQEDYTIVIDDPVSSLDENRLFSSAQVIQSFLVPVFKDGNWSGCKQIFILSHNLIFLKFMSNLLGSHDHTRRADIQIDKGEIFLLPNYFQNYQTSYFYKLAKIQGFVNNEIQYEAVRDVLPNFIRIVLETFLSFKFGRLCDVKGNKNMPAMLGTLIDQLSQVSLQGFKPVDGVTDKPTLVSALEEIRTQTNPDCHGTAQNIDHFEYKSETELMKLSKLTVNIIQYLDQIHYKKAQELKQAAA